MARENLFGKMERTKVTGRITRCQELAKYFSKMEKHMRDILKITKLKGMEHSAFQTGLCTVANGTRTNSKATGSSSGAKNNTILAVGQKVRRTASGNSSTLMDLTTKDISTITSFTVKGSTFIQTRNYTRGDGNTTKNQEKES